MTRSGDRRRVAGGILAGVGMGGFLDGIVLHQILRWHHMLSSVLPPTTMEAMHTNMVWDGLFHAFVWVVTLAGLFTLWSAARAPTPFPPARVLMGLLLIGWGLFNGVEGLINHQILGIHHVRGYGPDPLWDVGFLLTGPLLVGVGWLLARTPRSAAAR